MRRCVLSVVVLLIAALCVLPNKEGPRAQGGHAPGITMECDSVVPLGTQGVNVRCTAFDLSEYPQLDDWFDLMISGTYDSLGCNLSYQDVLAFTHEIGTNISNPIDYNMTDFELIFRYFAGGDTFPYLSFYDITDINERDHVDIYVYAHRHEQNCYRPTSPSSLIDTDVEDVGCDTTYHQNSLSVGGPCPSPTAEEGCVNSFDSPCEWYANDHEWPPFLAAVFDHEFAHMCWYAQKSKLGTSLGDVAHNEMFAHTAGYLGGMPYKPPRYNPDYDAGLIHGLDDLDGDHNRRRNLWTLWGAYLLQHYQGPSEVDIEDDLVYRWVHEPEAEGRTFYALARVLDDPAYAPELGDDGDERLTGIIRNWTIANWLNNYDYNPLYGYSFGFNPHFHVGLFQDNVGEESNEWRARSIPPDFLVGEECDNEEMVFSGLWTDTLSGGTDQIRVYRNASDYLAFRASDYFKDGKPHEFVLKFDGVELPAETELFLTAIAYSSATDSLFRLGEDVLWVEPIECDSSTLEAELRVSDFGSSVMGVAVVVSLVETVFPEGRLTVDDPDHLEYEYSFGAASVEVTAPEQTDPVWTVGSAMEVTWDCPPLEGDDVWVFLSLDGGDQYSEVLAEGVPNLGSYEWTVGDYDSDSCRVCIEVHRERGYILWGVNSENFTICDGVEVSVGTNPEGGEVWVDGVARDHLGVCDGMGGGAVEISVTSPQEYDDLEYRFLWWNDGGAQTHDIYPMSDTVCVATMLPSPRSHENWPVNITGDFATGPVLADVNGDGSDEVILVSGSGGTAESLYVFTEEGQCLPGFPRGIAGETGLLGIPAAGDLDGDGCAEIICADNSLLWVFDRFGEPRYWQVSPFLKAGTPMILDADYDGDKEIFYSGTGEVTALDHDGECLSGWPMDRTVNVTNFEMGAVLAAADVDYDGQMEIVSLPDVWNLDGTTLWEGEFPLIEYGPAAIGDLDGDGDLEIVACDAGGDSCYAWQSTGGAIHPLSGWPVVADGGVLPSLVDIDDDGSVEIIIGGPNAASVYDVSGDKVGSVYVYGDAQNEVMAADIYATNGATGELLTQRATLLASPYLEAVVLNDVVTGAGEYGWPATDLCSWCSLTPMAVGNLDADERLEIVAANGDAYVWDCDHDPSGSPRLIWPQFRAGSGHTGCIGEVSMIAVTPSPPQYGWCPGGDQDTLTFEIRVTDELGYPVPGIPESDIFAVIESTTGSALLCSEDTLYAGSPTDSDGTTTLVSTRIGGCGQLWLSLHVGEIVREVVADIVSQDMNGDCSVDSIDLQIWMGYFGSQYDCGDLDQDGLVGMVDLGLIDFHEGHLSIHPSYSSAGLNPSAPCIVFCPEGDMTDYEIVATARNARDSVFVGNSIPADSVCWFIPTPGPSGMDADFRFLCRQPQDTIYAENDTDYNEQTGVMINSGGGHSQGLPVGVEIGGLDAVPWTGTVVSPDIDADGVVRFTDTMIFSMDDQGPYHYRSDLNCDGFVDDNDFQVINSHYTHGCGAASHAVSESAGNGESWPQDIVSTMRAVVPNSTLDRWLSYRLHKELRAFLEHIRSLDEPAGLAGGSEADKQSAALPPLVTAMSQSTPNPFRSTSLIRYQVAPPGGEVELLIYDAAGRRVRTLVNQHLVPGYYSVLWNGRSDDGRKVANGVYFCQMKAPGFTSQKRMLLVR